MYQKSSNVMIVIFVCTMFVFSAPFDLVSKNRAEQETRLQERIAAMKADPDCFFYARSDLSPAEQEKIARQHLEDIQKLMKVEAFDSPDYDKILEHARAILIKAPETQAAQMAHWEIHSIYLTIEDDTRSAEKALESYINKYPDDKWRHQEAFDKLCVFAGEKGDWGAVLYYADNILEETPDRYALVLSKARALLHLGEKTEGKKLLERIITEDEGSVQYNLAMMEMDDLLAGKYDTPSEQAPGKDTAAAESDKAETGSGDTTSDNKMSEQKAPPENKTANDPLLVEEYRITMARMKQLLQGVQVFYLHWMKLPSSLQELLKEGYAREEDMRDSWGREFLFKADPDNETCWIASAGSDGRFEGFDQKGVYFDLLGRDIVAYDIDFVYSPDFRLPANRP